MAEYMKYQLRPGTVLDERYVIQEVLGEGGFGITYAGINRRVNVKVAIKEYFCRDYLERDCGESEQVQLLREESRERFEKEKKNFLREARILGDFSDEAGVVNVTDYFEANGTAYIVMGYLDGTTLREYMNGSEGFGAEEIFRKMLPLMETLGKIHDGGVIHRDISPDNIMLMQDGTMRLIDFGAARDYTSLEKTFSIISKGGYTPSEQYDSRGKQGPWTDIYALSATIYLCVTGVVPDDTLQRILHDELKTPSQQGAVIDRELEKILMKGLRLSPEDRYQDMAAMIRDIRRVLPEKEPETGKRFGAKKTIALGAAAGLLCVLLGGGLWYWKAHLVELKFRGIETETVWLTANSKMTTREFYEAAEDVKERVEVFAGRGNYLWEEKDGRIKVVTPLEVYQGKDFSYVLDSYIVRPWVLTVGTGETVKMTTAAEAADNATALNSEDIADVELCRGQVKGADRKELKLPESGDYTYLELEVSAEKAQKLQELLSTAGNAVNVYVNDWEKYLYTGYYLCAYAKGDGKTICIVDTDYEAENILQLTEHNLQQEPFAGALTYQTEWQVNWEAADENNIMTGEHQCNPGELKGETLLLEYAWMGSDEKRSVGAWYNVVAVFKERLDAFGIPYTFGVSADDDRNVIISVEKEKLWSIVARLLPETRMSVEGDWTDLQILTSYDKINVEQKEDGTYRVVVSVPDYTIEDMQKKSAELIADGQNKLYLVWEGHRIAECELTEPIEDGRVIFEKLRLENADAMNEETLPFLRFLETAFVESDMPSSYYCHFKSAQWLDVNGEIKDHEGSIPLAGGMDETRERAIQAQVEEQGGTLEWETGLSGEILTICFPKLMPEDFPKTALGLIESLYQKLELGDGSFDAVCFQMGSTSFDEGAGVFCNFNKGYGSREIWTSGRSHFPGDAKLIQETKEYIENSEFFQRCLAVEKSEWEYQ